MISGSTSTASAEPGAVEFCARVQIEKPSRKYLRDDLSAVEFANVLSDAGYFSDAVKIIAHLLPSREAVWWACQCARQNPLPDAEPEIEQALQTAEKWVAEMSDEARQSARFAAEAAGFHTAAGCAAMAVFMTAGMSLPDQPPLPIDPTAAAQLVSGSVVVSSLLPDPPQAPERYRTFLRQGIELYRSTLGS